MIENEQLNNLVWAERFRPKKLVDMIIPDSTRTAISDSIANGNVTHYMFTGTAGTGKSSLARVIANELNADLLFINASLEGIDSIRMKVIQYASTVSFSGGLKFVLLDEFDGMSTVAAQSLRGVIEEFPNTRFIFTANNASKIIPAIHSRCVVIDFKVSKEDAAKMQVKFFKRVIQILDTQSVEYEKPVVAELVKKYFPDFRRTLNELQRYSSSGKIDSGILLNQSESTFDELVATLKAKNFNDMRKWVGVNSDIDPQTIFTMLYNRAVEFWEPKCIPNNIIILAEASYRASMVTDPQIIVAACLTEIMGGSSWK